ncbi:hypothetical protein [Streptomyces sp. NPDC048603]|uniref:hypothetical protein n=1 Tax=Streptomyces sp. NPDC048603 TaxID=3365577 RepID=UPI00371DC1BD
MPKHSNTGEPGVAPTARRSAGTMFAALYGTLVPHAWRAPESELDAYALFHHRSIAMGWLDDTSAGGGSEDGMVRAPGLWGMNDAGWSHPLAAAGAGLISWFQVEAGVIADDRPLPVQPFLRCAEAATARAGTAYLSAVQLLLPVQGLGFATRPPYAPVPAVRTKEWFAECAPEAATAVEIDINSGQDRAVPAVAQQLADGVARWAQDVFGYRSHEVVGQEVVGHEVVGKGAGGQGAVIPPPFDDRFWNGPPLHGVVLRGELAEWTVDAIGWLGEVIADISAGLGVRSPLLLTVRR